MDRDQLINEITEEILKLKREYFHQEAESRKNIAIAKHYGTLEKLSVGNEEYRDQLINEITEEILKLKIEYFHQEAESEKSIAIAKHYETLEKLIR